jgi:hypothetical protein
MAETIGFLWAICPKELLMSNFWDEKIRELQAIMENDPLSWVPVIAHSRSIKVIQGIYGESFRKDALPSNPVDRAGSEERISKEITRICWQIRKYGEKASVLQG